MIWAKGRTYSRDMAASPGLLASLREKILKNWFVLGIITVILLARANPGFGAKGGKNLYSMWLFAQF